MNYLSVVARESHSKLQTKLTILVFLYCEKQHTADIGFDSD